MHKVRTSWPVATKVQYIVAFEECRRRWGLSARRFCSGAEIPYSTFARWWALWRKQGKRALLERSRRPRRSPGALPGQVLDVIRRAQRDLRWGVRRLHAYLRQAGLIRCSLSSVYRVLRRCGALLRRPRKPKPVWTRYAKAIPWERAQMDLKYLPQECCQLTLVDDCSRFLAATVLEKRTTAAVCQALPRLLKAFPFTIGCIQTDNGSEFGLDLTRLLPPLVHLPGSPPTTRADRLLVAVAGHHLDALLPLLHPQHHQPRQVEPARDSILVHLTSFLALSGLLPTRLLECQVPSLLNCIHTEECRAS